MCIGEEVEWRLCCFLGEVYSGFSFLCRFLVDFVRGVGGGIMWEAIVGQMSCMREFEETLRSRGVLFRLMVRWICESPGKASITFDIEPDTEIPQEMQP
jgi:hypothetical protein